GPDRSLAVLGFVPAQPGVGEPNWAFGCGAAAAPDSTYGAERALDPDRRGEPQRLRAVPGRRYLPALALRRGDGATGPGIAGGCARVQGGRPTTLRAASQQPPRLPAERTRGVRLRLRPRRRHGDTAGAAAPAGPATRLLGTGVRRAWREPQRRPQGGRPAHDAGRPFPLRL